MVCSFFLQNSKRFLIFHNFKNFHLCNDGDGGGDDGDGELMNLKKVILNFIRGNILIDFEFLLFIGINHRFIFLCIFKLLFLV
jgi:hypothetical protein